MSLEKNLLLAWNANQIGGINKKDLGYNIIFKTILTYKLKKC